MLKEKYIYEEENSNIEIVEGRKKSFDKVQSKAYSYRVWDGKSLGVHYQEGTINDSEGYALAEKNLELERPYKFGQETGVRRRDKTERVMTDSELMSLADEALKYLRENYPDFNIKGSVYQNKTLMGQTNDSGLEYENKDCNTGIGISFKHKNSKDISDGWFSISQRDFDFAKFTAMADNYLSNFDKMLEMPEELIIQTQYYELLGKFYECLDAEKMALGTSLFAGKVGERLFSEKFTLMHDVSDKECWNTAFFDGEGVVNEGDKRVFIEKGVLLCGFSDKKTADKYGVPHTGNAGRSFTDIPHNGNVNFKIMRSDKTVKELLDGRLSVIPLLYSGGGFNDNGEYAMPVQRALLCDGEKILGQVPPFTMVSNMYDIFGKDFIGVGSDDPVFNDKQIICKMGIGK